jgi:transcription initiation factor TFIID TATA-box-binding protein
MRKKMPEPTYDVVNIVASVRFSIKEKIDLNLIAMSNENAKYNPETFPGLILRLLKPQSTVLVFSTGKLVLTGFKKEETAKLIAQKVIQIIEQSGAVITSEPEIRIQNVVTAGDLNLKLDMDLMAISLNHVSYEPEVFPGLIYRMKDPKVVFLLFTSGKIVCVGAKSETDVKLAIQNLRKEIQDLDLTS